MGRTWSERVKGTEMFGRAIACVPGKTIARELLIKSCHQAIAGDLGDDGSCRNRIDGCIAAYDGSLWGFNPRNGSGIDQNMVGCPAQAGNRTAHRFERALVWVELIDFGGTHLSDAPGDRHVADFRKQSLTAFRADLFGVPDAINGDVGGKNGGCGKQGTRQRTHADLINPCDKTKAFGPESAFPDESLVSLTSPFLLS